MRGGSEPSDVGEIGWEERVEGWFLTFLPTSEDNERNGSFYQKMHTCHMYTRYTCNLGGRCVRDLLRPMAKDFRFTVKDYRARPTVQGYSNI